MPIDAKIRHFIKENGYIKIDEMMKQVLSIHGESYYRNVKNIGSEGDFITSPEISQLFGETIALWAIRQVQNIERQYLVQPKKFALVELGPGRGTMMRDLLRASKVVPEFFDRVEIYLYEINPHFIKKQKENLAAFNKNITWIDNFAGLPKIPTIIISNEFFDALPVKQYFKVKDQWYEHVFIIDSVTEQIKYSKIDIHINLRTQLSLDHIHAKDGAIFEESIETLDIIRTLSKHIKNYRGAALIIDYGYNIEPRKRKREQYNSTLQAIKNHRYTPIIDTLGEADLTAHVDFNAIEKAAKEQGIKEFNYGSQRDFLLFYGIEIRCEILRRNLPEQERYILDNQLQRLTAPHFMGELFKVLEFSNI